MPTETSSISFSESFSLVDKQGVIHSYTLSGTLEQKSDIVRTSAQSIKKALEAGWSVPSTLTPAADASSDPNSTREIVIAEQLVVTQDEKGKHFKIKGGKYRKHGVAVYEEFLPTLGIDPNLAPGRSYDFKKKVVVLTTKNAEGKTSSKVIELVK